MGEMFCFQSKIFKHDIYKSWRGLQDEKHLCDVTVACEGKQIDAHKFILSACSPVFRNLIKQNPHQHPLIYLRGVKYSELVHMLSFMYQGEVNIPQDDLQEFLEVGQDLKLAGMSQEEDAAGLVSRGSSGGERIKIEPTQAGGLMDEEEEESEPDDNPANDEYMILRDGGEAEKDETLDHYKPQSYYNDKEGVNFFYCDKCDYESFKVSDLKRHVAAKHKKERFPCDQCDYKTSTKYFLKRHVKGQHTEGQPKAKMPIYSCDHCDYTSSRNYNIQKHIKCMHKDKIPPTEDTDRMDESNPVQNNFVAIDESNTNVISYDGVEYSTQYIAQSSRPPVPASVSPSGLDFN